MCMKEKFRMKKKRRLKLWVKVVIYILIVGTLARKAFLIGEEMGLAFCQQEESKQEIFIDDMLETEISENEVEEIEVEVPYVIDPLILVNKEHRLPEEYEVELKTMYDKVNRAAKEAYGPLNDMLAAGRAEGLAFEICSSYRDIAKQEKLFKEDINRYMQQGYSYEGAYAKAAEYTMPPGHSEHSTGLAFDIVSLGYQMLDAGQENTAETQWLHKHCAEYGFILRYPKGKEEITNISYESWHYRYVGVEAATYIMEHGITLEEYLELNL